MRRIRDVDSTRLPDRQLHILTMDHSEPLEVAGRRIQCQPVWQWLLGHTPRPQAAANG